MRHSDQKYPHRKLTTTLKRLVFCALVIVTVSCSSQPELPGLTSGATIVAFGDSLTAGKGVSRANAYPAVLEKMTSHRVINSGVSGETSSEGLIRLPGVLKQHNPDLLIVFEGGNDILRNQDLSKTKRNLSQMIQLAKAQNIPVVLVGVPTKSLLGKTAGFYSELAQEHEIPLQDDIVGKLLRDRSMKSDSVHFNEAGYAALAEAIKALLEDSGAL